MGVQIDQIGRYSSHRSLILIAQRVAVWIISSFEDPVFMVGDLPRGPRKITEVSLSSSAVYTVRATHTINSSRRLRYGYPTRTHHITMTPHGQYGLRPQWPLCNLPGV